MSVDEGERVVAVEAMSEISPVYDDAGRSGQQGHRSPPGASGEDGPQRRATRGRRRRRASRRRPKRRPRARADDGGRSRRRRQLDVCRASRARLRAQHPDAHCELDHRGPFELLVATVLSRADHGRRGQQGHARALRRWPDAAGARARRTRRTSSGSSAASASSARRPRASSGSRGSSWSATQGEVPASSRRAGAAARRGPQDGQRRARRGVRRARGRRGRHPRASARASAWAGAALTRRRRWRPISCGSSRASDWDILVPHADLPRAAGVLGAEARLCGLPRAASSARARSRPRAWDANRRVAATTAF